MYLPKYGMLCGFLLMTSCCFIYRFIDSHSIPLLFSLFGEDYPIGGKPLSIFIENVESRFNIDSIGCSDCGCKFNEHDTLEPLIHCILKKSQFATKNKTEATFIFAPIYTNNLRNLNISANMNQIFKNDNAFKKWKGSRHLVVDSYMSLHSNQEYSSSVKSDHVLITTNLTIENIRASRWITSRHILVPPLQMRQNYPIMTKTRKFLFLGNSSEIKELFEKIKSSEDATSMTSENLLIENSENLNHVIDEVAISQFTVIHSSGGFTPFFIYEILRAGSMPVFIGPPFLPAYANTHVNYSKVSVRIPLSKISIFNERIQKVEIEEVLNEIKQARKFLMWPLDGIATQDNAAGVLFDYLNTRHRVLRPLLRRTFIGSDKLLP
ncbi:hypothetical protein TRFO_02106 [Tritrichomonas foetus]|uniref:Exostosin GT47 domain-containing protein n=1 Tax=Tritrichomonas foetus TaxID=1144522 RepID=A0A1J4J7H1_9EUKA|nr:hypothetical protein TRFO_02106 [Tritrichomonas foetus]|eukprot:OHS95182.1 hypothetical protein TRFO_02106 [Tritrichomonas foetus]